MALLVKPPEQLPGPQSMRSYSDKLYPLFLSIKYLDSTAAFAANAQHDPQDFWSFTEVTFPKLFQFLVLWLIAHSLQNKVKILNGFLRITHGYLNL